MIKNLHSFKQYFLEISRVKNQSEHSARTALENLLNELKEKVSKDIEIIHEEKPKDRKKGVPDFSIKNEKTQTIIGYIETKKIGENLDEVLKSEQIQKYKTLTDNLIITDYLRWIWIYKDEIIKDERICEKALLEDKNIKLIEKDVEKIQELIDDFLSQQAYLITKASELAKILAQPTRTIKKEIEEETNEQIKNNTNLELVGLFNVFKENISENITTEEFADAFSQTLTYSLFLTKLNLQNQNEKLTLNNIANYTPQSFALIKDILKFIQVLDKYSNIKPYIERILHIINHIDAFELVKNLKFTKDEDKDPYIYFYEDFLKAYDSKIRVDAGVYYTPEAVVRSIINNIHEILRNDFNLQDGLADKNVKVLDFACGTGTFLFQVYEKILSTISPSSLKRKNLVKEHILKNMYGFELLIPAYCVSHLKLSQYLKENANYHFENDDRIQVYLTNTLENRNKFNENMLFSLIPEIAKEGRKAQEIKENNDILVITGNPPYNGNSQNNFKYIQDLILPYFPNDEIKEKNPKWLNDDYVKFIRFAENKIEKAGKGVVGIITNHSFIDNPTFREMRKHLMTTFDKIYIIDLHGNTKKKEKNLDGGLDQNVFDIQQGVAISFFIKNEEIKDKGIYHLDIFGKRKEKFEQINQIDLKTTHFTKINSTAPFYLFIPQNENLREEYEKGISLRDIFQQMNVGIVTGRDEICIDFTKEKLIKKLKKFTSLSEEKVFQEFNTENVRDWTVKNAQADIGNLDENKIVQLNYRPFDTRYTHYTGKSRGLMQYPREEIMSHFKKENLGLVFVRQAQVLGNDANNICFISDKIIDLNIYRRGGACLAPLYLYSKNLEKEANFKPAFVKIIEEKFNNPSPEEVLAYIYAVLHSPNYRSKYLEFLKIDFPKIPFNVNIEKFKRLALIGQELIDAHLMKNGNWQILQIGEPESEGIENYKMEKVLYNEEKQRLYFNKTCYFSNVSLEIFEFKIGGYQVLDKYLKSRKDMDISENLNHIQNIIKVLAFTAKKMKEIDIF